MRLWLARHTEVSLREQLVTQVVLGILCGELGPGQRLPSTRELARRFRLHPNTVSAGYRELEREGWLEFRLGSGVYVRKEKPPASNSPAFLLDRMIADLFAGARGLGIPLAKVRARLGQCLRSQPPDRFVLIEPDIEVRRIVAAEIRQAVSIPVEARGLRDGLSAEALAGAIPVALPSQVSAARKLFPPEVEVVALGVRSATESLAGWLPAPANALVGVASRWPRFLKLARVMLVAAGFHPNQLIFRDARKPNWLRGLGDAAAVVSDSVTAEKLPKTTRAVVFRVLSEASLEELREVERFLGGPAET
jgi:GntR family transcriptional regulator